MRGLFTILFVGFSAASISQSIGKGIVLDAETKAAIPFAAVYYVDLGSGTIADSLGLFIYSGELPRQPKLKITALGYASLVTYGKIDPSVVDTFYLQESHLQLEEVIVSAPGGEMQKQTISNIQTRKLSELNVIQSNSLGEAISNIPNVYQSTTGIGISKPVIRGLSGSRVVTYLNGLRIENQQWGGDHGMGVDEIGIGSVEVIKGPASLLFGADALGGVVYFVDDPYENQNTTSSSFQTRFNSVSMGTDNTLSVKTAKKNFRVNAYANYANHADYQIPNSLYIKNSRYNKINAKLSMGFNRKKWVSNLRYNYLSMRIGLPGHTHEAVISPELFQSNEQNRREIIPAQVINNHYILFNNKFYLNRGEVVANLGFTSNRLTEFDEKVTIPGIDMTLTSGTYNVYYKGTFFSGLRLTLGVQGMAQNNLNNKGASEKLIPNANTFDNGGYLLGNFTAVNWVFEAGIRYDNRIVRTNEVFEGNYKLNRSYSGFNYSFGFSRDTERSTIRGNVSSGYRAPQSIELLANGVHHGTLTYDIGDQGLKSEKAIQADVSYEYHSEHFEFVINPFYNHLQDYIYRNPEDSIIDGLPVFRYTQADYATLTGGSVGFHYHPHFVDNLHLESSYSNVYAFDETGTPLPRIPQNRINTFLKYEFHTKSKVKVENIVVQHQYLFDQNRVSTVETTTPGYHLLNLGINTKVDIKVPIELRVGVKNVLNTEYIDHLSRLKALGLQNPGRNYYVNLKINISKSKQSKS